MKRFLEASKKRIVIVTYVLLFCMFCFFSLMDLQKRTSDYAYFANKINSFIKNAHDSESEYLCSRLVNYVTAIAKEKQFAELLKAGDAESLQKVAEPVFQDFGKRYVPVISVLIYDGSGNLKFHMTPPSIAHDPSTFRPSVSKEVFATRKYTYGYETNIVPLYFCTVLPVRDALANVVGTIEIGVDVSFFHYNLKWFFSDVRTAIFSKGRLIDSNSGYKTDSAEFVYDYYRKLKANDAVFFSQFKDRIDFRRTRNDIQMGDRYYLVSTSQVLRDNGGREVGKYLVAYDMTELRRRHWGYFYVWLLFFAITASVMLCINLVGFRKYERIITEQGNMLAQRSKQCALGEMLGHIGHQWRQPLYNLSLIVQNIGLQNQFGKLDDALLNNQITQANQNIQYMSNIIDDWRSLLMSGSSRTVIELQASVERAIAMVAPVMEQSRVTIENRITSPVHTMGFVNDLVQLTINVLLNARDQLTLVPGDRLIVLSCREEAGDLVTVTFQDNGGGIPDHLLKRIFEPYVTTKDKADGTGLGLYLCQQIVGNLDQGKVWAENRSFELRGETRYGACICLQFARTNEGGK
ncbi:sensor histidine kinase [Geomonas subterranea]|uniref:Sensor histidine kinase n=1 Tax=Geomonas subterranea TaxID=2847989 RepID=A0ABX8LBI5_9BACT|nr:HAMP domain-containing sensor histidine kinase [Geomonas subterranea]QXE89373.1 sensor histidine kinase [Geomonas subterranea]QXM08511.1 sensor histidine kinase [Geomonas subterranea]